MKKIFLFGVVILLLSSSILKAQSSDANDVLKKRLDAYLTQGVTNGLSGAVLVAKEGSIILNKGYGMANKEKKILNTPATVFDIGSVTKQFTGAAILKLVEFNKLKVTDPLSQFFKDIPDDKKDITVHQLLTHSAGLLDVIGEDDFDHIPTAAFFNELFASELLHKPGSKHEYSNSGYSILARIIELVSGQDYEAFLDEHLFKPAGMKQTGYLRPKWDSNLFAKGYEYGVMDIGSMATRYRKEGKISWVLKGNGGINSTQEDMYRWYIALKTNKVLSKSQIEIFTKPYVSENEENSSHYAYGWAIFNTNRNTKMVTHNGSNGIFFHDFIWLPEEDIVIIYSTNAYDLQVEDIAWHLEEMLFDTSYIPEKVAQDPITSLLKFTLSVKGNVEGFLK